jgi:hypothetical protein
MSEYHEVRNLGKTGIVADLMSVFPVPARQKHRYSQNRTLRINILLTDR